MTVDLNTETGDHSHIQGISFRLLYMAYKLGQAVPKHLQNSLLHEALGESLPFFYTFNGNICKYLFLPGVVWNY